MANAAALAQNDAVNAGRQQQDDGGNAGRQEGGGANMANAAGLPIALSALSPVKVGPIRVRISARSPDSNLSKAGRPYFHGRVTDNSASRKILAFGTDATDIEPQLVVGKEYSIERFKVIKPDRKFNTEPVELVFGPGTMITQMPNTISPDTVQYSTFDNALKLEPGSTVNIMCIITSVDDPEYSSGGTMFQNLNVIDSEGTVTKVVVFSDQIRKHTAGTVIQVLDGKIKQWGGDTFFNTSATTSIIYADETHPLMPQLKGVHQEKLDGNQNLHFVATPPKRSNLHLLKTESLGVYEVPNVTVILASQRNMTYVGCKNCRRKITCIGNRMKCATCGIGVQANDFFSLSVKLDDYTGESMIWVTLFDNVVQSIFGINAEQYCLLPENEKNDKIRGFEGRKVSLKLKKEKQGVYMNYKVLGLTFD